jgi:ribonucleotide reductase beta subunit family protein with ferritin-like domain
VDKEVRGQGVASFSQFIRHAHLQGLIGDDTAVFVVRDMLAEAVDCEAQFAADLLNQGVSGMSLADMRGYLQHVADRRLAVLGIEPMYGSKNPFAFMELQDVQELSNFF